MMTIKNRNKTLFSNRTFLSATTDFFSLKLIKQKTMIILMIARNRLLFVDFFFG